MCEIQLSRKNKHRANGFLHTQTNVLDSCALNSTPQQEVRQSLFMFSSSLDGHGTPSHETAIPLLPIPPSTR